MKLVFATNNLHKLQEVQAILPDYIEVITLKEIGFEQEIEEIGKTLEENSKLKAQIVYIYLLQHPEYQIDGVFADDTGLEIMALGGKPGVYSARWAGEPSNAAKNRQKVLTELIGVDDRRAQFRTVVTLIMNGKCQQVEGVIKGYMTTEERGDSGFGYDPIFIPEGYENTFAELSAETKNTISHRGRAMQALCEIL